MGGNAKAVYRNSGTIKIYRDRLAYAEKVPISNPDEFVSDIDELLSQLNLACSSTIWNKDALRTGSIFFGSFETLRDLNERRSFLEHKTFIGDIDVAIESKSILKLHEFLVANEEKKVSSQFVYVGQNREKFSGKKINCIFFYERCRKFLQIDFEAMEFKNGAPLDYYKFMRSSPWEDMQEGIKGLGHKYLLACIARCVSYKENIVILTAKSPLYPPNKIRIKNFDVIPHSLVFSKEGMREKLQQQKRAGFPVMIEGKYAYKELSKEESTFETDLRSIFRKLFLREPVGNDISNMKSYVGLMKIMKKTFTQSKIEKIYEHMVSWKLWGEGQALSRDSAEEDKDIKEMIIYTMESTFPYLVGQVPLEKIMEEYYKNYQVREEED